MLTIIAYAEAQGDHVFYEPEHLPKLLASKEEVVWVDLCNPTAEESSILSRFFNFHPLAIEDCMTETLLPKIDDFGDYIFMVLHGPRLGPLHGAGESSKERFGTVELNFFLGKNYLVTYHDEPSSSIHWVRDRRLKRAPIAARGADFLLQEVLDEMVDQYLPVLDYFDKEIEDLEGEIFTRPTQETLNRIVTLKKEAILLRRIIAPQRTIVSRLSRDRFSVVSQRAAIYYRDIYDHLARIGELSETYRDLITGALEAYLSVVSNRLSEVMKVLTMFTAVLMPLTLITGIYGMNFKMPELDSPYGYGATLLVMGCIAAGMVYFFRRKHWL